MRNTLLAELLTSVATATAVLLLVSLIAFAPGG